MMKMKLSGIKISNTFTSTTPKEEKMSVCRDFWINNHKQIKDIVVNKDNVLVDGYVQYLILKENNIEDAEVVKLETKKPFVHKRYKIRHHEAPSYKKETTTYIFGIHPDSKLQKEYVWRVPVSWKGWENDLLPGDRILVYTEYGIKPIIITRIEWSDKCPVNMKVKKVYKKQM